MTHPLNIPGWMPRPGIFYVRLECPRCDHQEVVTIRFNGAGEFVEIEKFVRPVEDANALGNAMGSLIGSQIKALRAAA